MSTMTEDEVMDSTSEIIAKWFTEDSKIMEACFHKEEEMSEIYGEGEHACPYLESMLQLAQANIYKGWPKEELMRLLDELLVDDETIDDASGPTSTDLIN